MSQQLADHFNSLLSIVLILIAMAFVSRHVEPSSEMTPEQLAGKARRRDRMWWCGVAAIANDAEVAKFLPSFHFVSSVSRR